MKILAVTLSLPWRKEHAVVKLLESADPGLITVAQTRRDGGEKYPNFLFVFPVTDENVYEDLPELC